MSPVTIEAVYERVPTAPERRAPARVRVGFRARFSAGRDAPVTGTDEGPPSPSAGPRRAAPVAGRELVRHRGGPRRGPREARPDPGLLAYAEDGLILPLAAGTGRGTHLDLLA